MERMEQKILREGKVLPGGILKVGSFLNQQIDTAFLAEIGQEVARLFEDSGVTKILTIESSGIAIAASVGMAMGVPPRSTKPATWTAAFIPPLSTPIPITPTTPWW